MSGKKTRVGFLVGNYHTDHPSRLVHQIWALLKDEDVELQVFLGTESASFIKDFTMRSNLFDYQYASLCGYTEYAALDLLIISVGTLSIYQNAIPLDEFLRHTPNIPTILMETDRDPVNGISLIADNTQGLASCVEHLIADHGLTRIGFITGPDNNQDARERFEGYRRTLEKHGIPLREDYIVAGDYSEHVDKSVEKLLDQSPDLQAIVSTNDEMTIAVYRVLAARGLKVGRDIAVTGFDDMLMAQYMDPPLTTARQDYDAFSRQAVKSALAMIRGEKAESRRIPAPFIRRCSCGCAPETVNRKNERPEHADLLRSIQRSREYQHNSWVGSLMNRELLLTVDDRKKFFASIGAFMAYLGTPSSNICLFEQPLRVSPGTIPEFPEKIYMCMRQEGDEYFGYNTEEAPVLCRKGFGQSTFIPSGSDMTFLLFDEEYQYGVMTAEIDPEKIDFYYMLSLDIGTSLRYMDIWAQQKQYRAELQAMARTDELTGLYNRAGLVSARESLTAEKARPVTVIMADLDHLKQINDTFGHHEGDRALRAVAVADILRKVLGARRIIARVGGDEFQICLSQTNEELLNNLVRRVKQRCDAFNERSELPYFLEISLGFSVGTVQSREDWEALAAEADKALYEAKKTRRDFVIR